MKKTVKKTVDKFEAKKSLSKLKAAKAKEMIELKEKVNGKKQNKFNQDDNEKMIDTNRKACSICCKFHRGECWKKVSNRRRNDKPGFDKKQTTYIIKQLVVKQLAYPNIEFESDSESEGPK